MAAAGRAVTPPDGLRGLALDVDDTLLSTREAMREAGAAAARELWPDADPVTFVAAGRRYHADPQGHFRAYTRGEHDLDAMRRYRVREVADWMGRPYQEDDASRWRAVFDEVFAQSLMVFDDVIPTLDRCWAAGIPVAFLTNAARDYTWTKLARCGLAEVVQDRSIGVVTTDTLGFGKPDPAVFRHAASLLELAPSQVAHVGDELDVDPLAALAAGMGAAWVRRPGYEVDATDLQLATTHGLAPAQGLAEALRWLLPDGASGFGSAASAR